MASVRAAIWLPEELWHAIQLLAAEEGDANTVILRAVEEYLLRSCRQRARVGGRKYRRLVAALSTPVSALDLSARAASCLRLLGVRYVGELTHHAEVPDTFRMLSR